VLSYGRRYYLARIGTVVDRQVGGLFLAMIATQSEIGLFVAASALIQRTGMVSDSIESSLLPRVASDPLGRPDLVSRCVRLSGLLTSLVLLALAVASVPLVRVLLSSAFLPAVQLIWIMTPGMLLYGASGILMAYFRGRNRPEVCSRVVWAGLAANVAALLVLYPRIGLPAAAWAMSIGLACRSLILVVAFRRASGWSLRATWSPKRGDLGLLRDSGRQLFGRFFPSPDRSSDV
jgi:O-antigen/teichoic acid export membrane protein